MLTVRNARLPIVRGMQGGAMVGLFETDSDVRSLARKIDVDVVSLDADANAYITSKYGALSAAPAGDVQFFNSWALWRSNWGATKKDIDSTSFYILSANKYRELQAVQEELNEWRGKMVARGIAVSGSTPKQPGTGLPSVTPGVNGGKTISETFSDILFWGGVGVIVYLGLFYVAPLFIGAATKTKRASHEYSSIGSY